uniref:Plastid light harvesting protein n=1 Tax=Proboscia inermis TaxID=420281 RepID=A0A7S0BZB7_9STRA|mmetsp:Transcript_16162/g.16337  ORF Transcript_16162/g.16337 Transcript_16162/m.16337 type:complete len:261 (+) Transcript_16162:94-876(+)|eukprot:CAMPEP_0194357708 /NCGR_PEP_ID=MMETSP0174-20130528/5156_1 /TAXON_ID=216777 /ORGANISM="Proboscia alata, Strain PI-D3" /LENGTH=260 /DNA_ID=CAMNT_0039127841 /DNA_START=74 /DNA_END=856 /DNA_ORIENTATION=+
MKVIITTVLGLIASASAFTGPQVGRATTAVHETKADLEALALELNPVIGYYDPLNLADAEFWGTSNEATIGFLRHAEIKHGRVAMFAFVGYCVHANGIKFPWAMQRDGTPFPSETNPPMTWDAVSDAAKWQIFGLIFFLEFWSEFSFGQNTHYMQGGKPGDFPDFTNEIPHPVPFSYYDPFGLAKKMSAEKKQTRLVAEINNGRLAMLGIIAFLSAQVVPGSVPALSGIVQPYSGNVMAPFSTNIFSTYLPKAVAVADSM